MILVLLICFIKNGAMHHIQLLHKFKDLNTHFIQPPRVGEVINKVKPKRLSPSSSSSFAKDHFPPSSFPTTPKHPIDVIRNTHASSSSSSKGAFVVDPTFSPFNIQTAAAGSSAGGFFPKPYEHSIRYDKKKTCV